MAPEVDALEQMLIDNVDKAKCLLAAYRKQKKAGLVVKRSTASQVNVINKKITDIAEKGYDVSGLWPTAKMVAEALGLTLSQVYKSSAYKSGKIQRERNCKGKGIQGLDPVISDAYYDNIDEIDERIDAEWE